MARLEIASIADGVAAAPLDLAASLTKTAAIIDRDDQAIALFRHDMAQGGAIAFDQPLYDHSIYVLEGDIDANGEKIGAGGAVTVEHGATARLRGLRERAVLLDFVVNRPDPSAPVKPGRHVHVVSAESTPRGHDPQRNMDHALYADSDCETCNVWLHETSMPAAFRSRRHYHTEDEIIVIIRGSMEFGVKSLPAGAVLSIPQGAVYGFDAGADGLAFINFRPSRPWAVLFDPDTREKITLDEAAFFHSVVNR